ncbi:type II secretion system secretin GspD [Inhella gelatinilytica]|uniref:Type IV pilus biogenesis and competence protein PilQ n=1 Tax=Inhella gelatinilytica TaxID=2795030 RepID=A0A931IYZ7_9BURK|nr:type II secretion system secretin GspD [Inhella gelatinilytica]MBH9552406.1 type II secretion system secretin GspD [Inhella gelatinilytica]
MMNATLRTPRPLLQASLLSLALSLAAPSLANPTPALKPDTLVALNFVNAEIESVARAMGNMLGRSMMVDPRVKGAITLYAEQPLKASDAFAQFQAALRGLGFSVIEVAGLYKVVPEADAKMQATTVAVDELKIRGDQILTQVFLLRHENANNLVAVLRPLINVNNTINANPGNNSLVITDYADNLKRLAKIIAAMDTAPSTDVEIVPLRHAVASDIATLVQRLGEGTATPGAPGAPAATTVVADPRSNALILRAPNAAKLEALKGLVAKLDRPASQPNGGIHVVYLKNADAAKLAQVLRAAFANAGSSASGSSTGVSPVVGPTTIPGAPTAMAPVSNAPGNTTGASAAATAPVAASAQPSTGGFIQADPSTNSLIITAPEPLYRQMRGVIDQLDGRRAQVYVEAMIVKVDASKGAQFGVQWQNLFGTDKNTGGLVGTNYGTGGNNIVNLIGAVATGNTSQVTIPSGLNLGIAHKLGAQFTLAALANFLEAETGANVLATPNLVALDNEEAKIHVGQNVPFLTGSFANAGSGTGSSINPFQTIERKDVGLTLRVKAQIGEGGAIRMVVFHENSSVVPGASTSTGPVTDKNTIETTVTVDDGGMLVLGGLIKDEYTDGLDGVPGLSKVPLVGALFRSENRKRVRTNLMVFLRPTVLRTAADATGVSLDRYDWIRAHQQKAQPSDSAVLPNTGAPVLPPAATKPLSGPVAP